MAASFNRVTILGTCGRDPEIRYLPSGKAVANISLATSSRWKDKTSGESREETQWHRVTFYDRLAEVVGEYVKKGSSILIEGELKYGKYQDKDGVEKSTTDIVAREMQLVGGKREAEGGNQGNYQPRGNDDGNQGNYQPRGNDGGNRGGNQPRGNDGGNRGGNQGNYQPRGNDDGNQDYPPARTNPPAAAQARSNAPVNQPRAAENYQSRPPVNGAAQNRPQNAAPQQNRQMPPAQDNNFDDDIPF